MYRRFLLLSGFVFILQITFGQIPCDPKFYIKGGNQNLGLISKTELGKSMDIMVVGTEPDSLLNLKVSVSGKDGVMKTISDKWANGASTHIRTLLMNAPIGSQIYIGGTFMKNGKSRIIPNCIYKVCKKKTYELEYTKLARVNKVMINNGNVFKNQYYYKTYGDAFVEEACDNVRTNIKLSAFTFTVLNKEGAVQLEEHCDQSKLSQTALDVIEQNVGGKILIKNIIFKTEKKALVPGQELSYDIIN